MNDQAKFSTQVVAFDIYEALVALNTVKGEQPGSVFAERKKLTDGRNKS
jgi:hypothetical protein